MKKFKSILTIFLIFAISVSILACDGIALADAPRQKIFFEYFDTVSYIYDHSNGSDSEFDENCELASSLLSEYHRMLDIYNEYSGLNNICTINKNAGGDAVEVDERLTDFLLYAKEICSKTDGEVNIMMGSVLKLWREAREASLSASSNTHIPASNELQNAAKHTSTELLVIDTENNTVRITDPDASIDVGALGKGYVAQKLADALFENGADAYVLDLGGNLKLIGTKPGGFGWMTGIRDPENTQNYAHKLTLANTSCATSGDYERYFTVDGKDYHHIIDKDTLMPAEHFSSVTVITPDSALADALSTALFCMSYEDGCEMLKKFDNVEVIWITRNGEKLLTDGLK